MTEKQLTTLLTNIDPELKKQLKLAAYKNDTDMTAVVIALIKEYIAKNF